MAVLAIFTGAISKAQYEILRNEVKWETNQPARAMFHAAGFDESDEIHVADVWASPEEMNAFVTQRLLPAFNRLGFAPPTVTVYPVHNINAYKTLEQHRI